MQTTVRDLLKKKGSRVSCVHEEQSVFEAVERFIAEDIGSVLVMDGDHLIGLVSERELAHSVVLGDHTERETKVKEIMVRDVVCVRPDQTIEDCMALMTAKRVRHLPVIERDKVIGVVSMGDLVKATVSEKQFVIEQLENYIAGRI